MVLGVDSEATAGEGLPQETLVGTAVTVSISLNPGVTSGGDWKTLIR